MNELKIFVENRYKHKINTGKFEKFLIMADTLDSVGSDSCTWDEKQAFDYYVKNNSYTFDTPTVNEWKEFFAEEFISNLLLDFIIKSKKVVLRKIIANIDETKGISQGDMKALAALDQLIKKSDDSENNMVYVQYISPIRCGEHNSEKIVMDLLDKEVSNEK